MKPVANKRQPRFFSAFRNNSHADNVWFIRRAACEPGNKTMAFFDHIWQFTLIRPAAIFSLREKECFDSFALLRVHSQLKTKRLVKRDF